MNSLIFKKIKNENIFDNDFEIFNNNNEIKFSTKSQIAVLYGPNGTGKTSLVETLNGKKNTYFELEFNEQTFTKNDNLFYIIKDQNHRNIIAGNANDFLIGDNIREEYELKQEIEEIYSSIKKNISEFLKRQLNITTKQASSINLLPNNLKIIVSDFANSKAQGKNILIEDILSTIDNLNIDDFEIDESDVKLNYVIQNYNIEDSLLNKVLNLEFPEIKQYSNIEQVEENSEALKILEKFKYKHDCIVCDTKDINPEKLINSKTTNKETILNQLSEPLKNTINDLIQSDEQNDVFQIKKHLITSLQNGDAEILAHLQDEIKNYLDKYAKFIILKFKTIPNLGELKEKHKRYSELIDQKPDISSMDYLYIKDIVNSMNKDLNVDRDNNKNLKIYLKNNNTNNELLGRDRDELPLSTGEQNFLSLSFELLKAKNCSSEIVVMDDPISSFDSIYKNKVVYAILKFLPNKKQMIFTHNLDLVRLMEAQFKNSFEFYLFNNVQNEDNGFIPLSNEEFQMMLYLDKLLEAFSGKLFPNIIDVKSYLISLIPFMRGYSKIKNFNDKTIYNKLTALMHGYKQEKIDIVPIYQTLFNPSTNNILPSTLELCANDIIQHNVDNIEIIDNAKYRLLDKTLRHSLSYLKIRLEVEKTLKDAFNLQLNDNDQLGEIIDKAFPSNDSDIEKLKFRTKLMSKKTLINEFNHFEGNLSIFQPAIDISDKALGEEKQDIISILRNIKVKFNRTI